MPVNYTVCAVPFGVCVFSFGLVETINSNFCVGQSCLLVSLCDRGGRPAGWNWNLLLDLSNTSLSKENVGSLLGIFDGTALFLSCKRSIELLHSIFFSILLLSKGTQSMVTFVVG